MKTHIKSRPFAVSALIFLQIFLGLNGLLGGGAFLLAPDGHLLQMPFSHLQNTPFPDFLIPGLLLFMFLGLYPIAVAYSLWKQPAWRWPDTLNPFKQIHWSWAGSLAAGVIAMIWIIVQIQWIPAGFLHIFIVSWGILILLVTLMPSVRRYYKRHS
ncbi:MAG: hypothetical protein EHM40_17195 [Chloroflexi bacterium]|nr:MAG: hypothetical protein EHM40_17195 [Chloroflexota bacterium]